VREKERKREIERKRERERSPEKGLYGRLPKDPRPARMERERVSVRRKRGDEKRERGREGGK
jgi:hypothetical protein